MSDFPQNKYSNTITSAAFMLGVSPESIDSYVKGKQQEYISKLEKEKNDLTNTVHRLIKDRQRILEDIKQLFSQIKE